MLKVVKIAILNLCLPFLFAFQGGSMRVNVPHFNDITAFPDMAYEQHNWQSFSKSEEAKSIVDPANPDIRLLGAAVFYATNRARAQLGQSQLGFSAQLRDAAQTHSYLMVKQDFFSHTNPQAGPFHDMKSRIENFGFAGQSIGENIAKGFVAEESPKSYWEVGLEVVDQFMHSPEHKANMLRPSYTNTGQAVYFYPNVKEGYWYFTCTQDYGKVWED
jgi:uncharacterized protein YkwD